MQRIILPQDFFSRSTTQVAYDLLGKFLVRRWRGSEFAAMVTEVEAYDGFRDRGSHASRGRTARNAPMFGPPGHWYIYFTYGMHWMLNVVTREEGYPAAVLIRGVAGVSGPAPLEIRRAGSAWRQPSWDGLSLTGPARVTKKLHIDKKLNGLSATKKSGLWIEDRGFPLSSFLYPLRIRKGPRIGIAYAGPYWARRNWRFRVPHPRRSK
jgi:DNA-3-methyladenine glycosylase